MAHHGAIIVAFRATVERDTAGGWRWTITYNDWAILARARGYPTVEAARADLVTALAGIEAAARETATPRKMKERDEWPGVGVQSTK